MNRTVTMQQSKRAAALNIRTITMTALLSAMAYVLAFVEFPVPLSPSFAKMDLSDFPALIGAFAFGPISGRHRRGRQLPDGRFLCSRCRGYL